MKKLAFRLRMSNINLDRCYNSKFLEWDNKTKSLYLTQENSIENFVQDYLLYILLAHSLCSTTLAYLK